MYNIRYNILILLWVPFLLMATDTNDSASDKEKTRVFPKLDKSSPPTVKVLNIIPERKRLLQQYPYALGTLLKLIDDETTIPIETSFDRAPNFEDESIFDYPLIYMNYAHRDDWQFSELEKKNLKRYLERGGFIYIDAGINAEFLQNGGQNHSFAEWKVSPDVGKAFKEIFPNKSFKPLKRNHHLFRSFYKGLPDPSILPETVRDFVVKEKWPQGTFSAVGLTVNARIAVLCTPIISMGWGRDQLGNWQTTIGFRIRESAKDLGDVLSKVQTTKSYETNREDGRKDQVFCIDETPSFVKEPDGRWRVFRYYRSTEISNYAHEFYSRLGVNIVVYAMTH